MRIRDSAHWDCEDDPVDKYCWNRKDSGLPGDDVCEKHKLKPDQKCWQKKIKGGKLTQWHRQDKLKCQNKWKDMKHKEIWGSCRTLDWGFCKEHDKDSDINCIKCKFGYEIRKEDGRAQCCEKKRDMVQ